ncbi:MAG: hypothetical protein KGO96_12245 [Elusimicrobia bacterium]|nr:hypothetical protein [Elusimicrobiota bacterium]
MNSKTKTNRSQGMKTSVAPVNVPGTEETVSIRATYLGLAPGAKKANNPGK